MMGALERRQKLVGPADQIRRSRQQFEIHDIEWSFLIGERERPEGCRPGPASVGLATAFEFVEGIQDV